jgi:class 3 adenylate cyclase
MGADAVPYGRGDDQRHAMFQSALVATLQTAAAAAGLSWERWIWERAGDGGLALLPLDQPAPLLVDEFVRALDRTLAWLNRELARDARLRLRIAINRGTAIPAENGWAGQGVVAVSRLLDSHPIRLALAAADQANFAVILSRQVFEEVVRPGGGSLRPTSAGSRSR